jgi:hypothetical protein
MIDQTSELDLSTFRKSDNHCRGSGRAQPFSNELSRFQQLGVLGADGSCTLHERDKLSHASCSLALLAEADNMARPKPDDSNRARCSGLSTIEQSISDRSMTMNRFFVITVLVMSGLLTACEKSDDTQTTLEKAGEVASDAAQATKEATGEAIEYTGDKMQQAGEAVSETGESMQTSE